LENGDVRFSGIVSVEDDGTQFSGDGAWKTHQFGLGIGIAIHIDLSLAVDVGT